MIFTEFRFILFFILVFSIYWKLPNKTWKKLWLLICSYIFYGIWDWRFLSLIIGSTFVDYMTGLKIYDSNTQIAKKAWLTLSLSINLGILGFFKYYNFFVDSLVHLFDTTGLSFNSININIILPAGISFYTLQTLSYSLDIYFGKLTPQKNFLNLACFVAFFPQLLAGPIVRASDFLPQLTAIQKFRNVNVKACLVLFIVGFFKKACISDNLAPFVDNYFSAVDSYTALSGWLATMSYAVQIYCDFSGYSDMAIACAGLLGYNLCVNFDAPYFSSSITEFWRRWHISLSNWLRDYLYIPLGGNRDGTIATYRNLIITMLIGGLWHGAAWRFVVWGALHGIALVCHKEWSQLWNKKSLINQTSKIWGVGITFYWVCFTWIFFRANSFIDALSVAKAYVLFQSPGSQQLEPRLWLILVGLAALHWVSARMSWTQIIEKLPNQVFAIGYGYTVAVVMLLMSTGYAPFIYFQF
ncbi:membrane bound o-acyl transferase mboat family protein [Leptolyngbya sp. Heron Island J]|uniref:MBOAT family O-acyltransferase n=1 Tax=Leptolyngbya sp. Heron Island J TaxID=1385935 RepID=UPI0003B9A7BB|nr:MBOAT family O-acyltransferase [Leptolyngbya sp. Heron Island J]ESA37596.1 membrane bound o-acyl transferase mboat family protein [Leptolyngbya sp. Heron Island J]